MFCYVVFAKYEFARTPPVSRMQCVQVQPELDKRQALPEGGGQEKTDQVKYLTRTARGQTAQSTCDTTSLKISNVAKTEDTNHETLTAQWVGGMCFAKGKHCFNSFVKRLAVPVLPCKYS